MLTYKQAAKRLKITVGTVRGIVSSGKVKGNGDGIEDASWATFEEEFRSRRWMLLISEDDLRNHIVNWAPLPAREITRRLLREGLAIGLAKGISGALRGWLKSDPRLVFNSPHWMVKPTPDLSAVSLEQIYDSFPQSPPLLRLMSAFANKYGHLDFALEDITEALKDPWLRQRHAELTAQAPIDDADIVWEGSPPLFAMIRALAHHMPFQRRQEGVEIVIAALIVHLARVREAMTVGSAATPASPLD